MIKDQMNMKALKSATTREWQINFIPSVDGEVKLRYATYNAVDSEPDRYFVYLNGRTEWIEKYDYLPDQLGLPANCGYLTMDHRGQGASEGERSYIDSYETFAADTATVIGKVVGSKPFVLVGHSMGGLISIYATLTGRISPQSIVLSGPLFKLPESPMPAAVSRLVSKYLTQMSLGKMSTGAGQHHKKSFGNNKLTHSFELFKRLKNTPYPVPSATFGWVHATGLATDLIFAPEKLKTLSVPVLVMAGTDDTVVGAHGFSDWVQQATTYAKAPVQLVNIPGARHELFSESPEYLQYALDNMSEWFRSFLK
jgi:lysophospholipase